MNLASANRANVGKPPLQWHSDGVLATLGWVVKASEGGTGWRLPTVTRADRSPTGEASLARGRLTSRQRLHEATVVIHQVQGSRPCRTHKLALHTRSAILPLSRRRSVHLRVVNAPTCKGTDRCGSWTTSGCVINALLICTRMVSFQHPRCGHVLCGGLAAISTLSSMTRARHRRVMHLLNDGTACRGRCPDDTTAPKDLQGKENLQGHKGNIGNLARHSTGNLSLPNKTDNE